MFALLERFGRPCWLIFACFWAPKRVQNSINTCPNFYYLMFFFGHVFGPSLGPFWGQNRFKKGTHNLDQFWNPLASFKWGPHDTILGITREWWNCYSYWNDTLQNKGRDSDTSNNLCFLFVLFGPRGILGLCEVLSVRFACSYQDSRDLEAPAIWNIILFLFVIFRPRGFLGFQLSGIVCSFCLFFSGLVGSWGSSCRVLFFFLVVLIGTRRILGLQLLDIVCSSCLFS